MNKLEIKIKKLEAEIARITAPVWWKHCVVKDVAAGSVSVVYSIRPIIGEHCTYHQETHEML